MVTLPHTHPRHQRSGRTPDLTSKSRIRIGQHDPRLVKIDFNMEIRDGMALRPQTTVRVPDPSKFHGLGNVPATSF